MKRYYFPGAPSPRKVGVVVAEKGLEIPTVTLNLRAGEHLTEEFAAVNPGVTLPALKLEAARFIVAGRDGVGGRLRQGGDRRQPHNQQGEDEAFEVMYSVHGVSRGLGVFFRVMKTDRAA